MNTETSTDQPSSLWPAIAGLCKEPLYWLLLALPLAVVLEFAHAGGLAVFLASGVAIIPLAGLMGRATESLSLSLNPGIGGLLNATLGNAAELIIALFALSKGPEMYPLVKASLTGSIIGNVLLVMGASIVKGHAAHKQHFSRTGAGMRRRCWRWRQWGWSFRRFSFTGPVAGGPRKACGASRT